MTDVYVRWNAKRISIRFCNVITRYWNRCNTISTVQTPCYHYLGRPTYCSAQTSRRKNGISGERRRRGRTRRRRRRHSSFQKQKSRSLSTPCSSWISSRRKRCRSLENRERFHVSVLYDSDRTSVGFILNSMRISTFYGYSRRYSLSEQFSSLITISYYYGVVGQYDDSFTETNNTNPPSACVFSMPDRRLRTYRRLASDFNWELGRSRR